MKMAEIKQIIKYDIEETAKKLLLDLLTLRNLRSGHLALMRMT